MKKNNIIIILGLLMILSINVSAECVLNMSFDSGEGTYTNSSAEDLSGYNNDANFVNAKFYGDHYFFNTTYISVPSYPSLNFTKNFSIVSTFSYESERGDLENTFIVSKGNNYYSMAMQSTRLHLLYKNTTSSQYSDWNGFYSPTINQKYYKMITFSADEGKIRYYSKGLLYLTENITTDHIDYNTEQLYIGRAAGLSTGLSIYDLLLFNDTRSESWFNSYYDNKIGSDKYSVAFLGDSITSRLGYNSFTWYLQNKNISTRNYAQGGITTEQLRSRSNEYINDINYTQYNIMIGTNDVSAFGYEDEIGNGYYINYSNLINEIQDNTTSKINLMSIPPRNGTLYTNATINYNKVIKTLSYENNFNFIDIFHEVFNGIYSDYLYEDFLHPNDIANIEMNKTIFDNIFKNEKYRCDLSPYDCYNSSKFIQSETPFIGNHSNDAYVTSSNYYPNNNTFIFSCNNVTTELFTIPVSNLDKIVSSFGYYEVYHNGIFVELSNENTYQVNSCSDWKFYPYYGIVVQPITGLSDTGSEIGGFVGNISGGLGQFLLAVGIVVAIISVITSITLVIKGVIKK